MIIAGFDPSFSCAGVSIMDTDEKKIWITDVRDGVGKVQNFENVFNACERMQSHIKSIFSYLEIEPDIFMSEKPFPVGQYSAGLFALDATLFKELMFTYDKLKYVFLISARFLTHVHKNNGIKKYKKSDSTNLVREGLLPVFEDFGGYKIIYGSNFNKKGEFKGGINNNSAESFIILSRLFVRLNIDTNAELLDALYGAGKGLFTEMETVLLDKTKGGK